MDNYIDLSSPDCPEVFRFHDSVLKVTSTGLTFYSWNGLRLYWITGKTNPLYLNGNNLQEVTDKDGRYVYISDLYPKMMDELKLNMARYPLLKLKLNKQTKVIWSAYGITPAEEQWVKVVASVISSM